MEERKSLQLEPREMVILQKALNLTQKALFFDQNNRKLEAVENYRKAINILENEVKYMTKPNAALYQVYVVTYKQRITILESMVIRRVQTSIHSPYKNHNSEQSNHSITNCLEISNDLLLTVHFSNDYEKIIQYLKIIQLTFSRGVLFTTKMFIPFQIWSVNTDDEQNEFYDIEQDVINKVLEIINPIIKLKSNFSANRRQELKSVIVNLVKFYQDDAKKLIVYIETNPFRFLDTWKISSQTRITSFFKKNISKLYIRTNNVNVDMTKIPQNTKEAIKTFIDTAIFVKDMDDVEVRHKQVLFAFMRDVLLKALFYDIKVRMAKYFMLMKGKYLS
jgi:hypothetical protein